MRKLLALGAAGLLAYGAARLMLRRPEPDFRPGTPVEPVAAYEGPDAKTLPPLGQPATEPAAARRPPQNEYVEEDAPPAELPWGTDAESRPNVRSLKVAGVPEPGRERSAEQLEEARKLDAAARAPSGMGWVGPGGAGALGSMAAGGPRAPRGPSAVAEETPLGSDNMALGGARAGKAPGKAKGVAAGAAYGPQAAATDGAKERGADLVAEAGAAKAAPPSPESVGWSPAANLVKEAKSLTFGKGDAALRQVAADPGGKAMLAVQAADSAARDAIAKLAESGQPVSDQQKMDAISNAYTAAGLGAPTEEELREQLAIASQPADPPPAPQQMADFLLRTQAVVPDPAERARIAAEAERQPRERDPQRQRQPCGPPPRNAAEAYRRVRDALEKGQRDFGVLPKHAFGIFGVESGFGHNTGRYPVMPVLYNEMATRAPGSARYRQAARDVQAMFVLERQGALGPGNTAANMRGSYGASFGHTQFRPSSWLAYGRDPDGGTARDPYDMRTAVYSTANYLRGAGYRSSVERAIFGYNHSDEYVRSVLNMAERVQNTIISRAGPATGEPDPCRR